MNTAAPSEAPPSRSARFSSTQHALSMSSWLPPLVVAVTFLTRAHSFSYGSVVDDADDADDCRGPPARGRFRPGDDDDMAGGRSLRGIGTCTWGRSRCVSRLHETALDDGVTSGDATDLKFRRCN